MLYFLVGSRELDGGLMCTASHNPKAYTGAKLVREGAIALSGDSGIQDIRRTIEAGLEPARRVRAGAGRARGTRRGGRHLRGVPAAALAFIDPDAVRLDAPAEGRGRRRQRHGRPDGRPAARAPGARADRDLLDARRQLPRPRAQPAAAREPASSSSSRCARAAPTSGSPGTATPTAASSSTTPARSSTATS